MVFYVGTSGHCRMPLALRYTYGRFTWFLCCVKQPFVGEETTTQHHPKESTYAMTKALSQLPKVALLQAAWNSLPAGRGTEGALVLP